VADDAVARLDGEPPDSVGGGVNGEKGARFAASLTRCVGTMGGACWTKVQYRRANAGD